jgi:hypothetical protein
MPRRGGVDNPAPNVFSHSSAKSDTAVRKPLKHVPFTFPASSLPYVGERTFTSCQSVRLRYPPQCSMAFGEDRVAHARRGR